MVWTIHSEESQCGLTFLAPNLRYSRVTLYCPKISNFASYLRTSYYFMINKYTSGEKIILKFSLVRKLWSLEVLENACGLTFLRYCILFESGGLHRLFKDRFT